MPEDTNILLGTGLLMLHVSAYTTRLLAVWIDGILWFCLYRNDNGPGPFSGTIAKWANDADITKPVDISPKHIDMTGFSTK